MDPVTIAFATYLNSLSNVIYSQMTDTMGLELKAVVIRYKDVDISYQYQMWRVRDQSVCGGLREGPLDKYSSCTIKAKDMFADFCRELSTKRSNDIKFTKITNMYCNAAVTYKPMIASISGETVLSEEEEHRKACNRATAAALGSSDQRLIAERNSACKKPEQPSKRK